MRLTVSMILFMVHMLIVHVLVAADILGPQ